MMTNIRLLSQQLVNPDFENPKELVAWMGAIQAQDYKMAKWAVGIRSKSATLQTVDEALRRGDITYSCHASDLAFGGCGRHTLDAEIISSAYKIS